MANYKVIWEIDIDAESPKEAAQIAREFQLDPTSIATFFEVRDESGVPTFIDLLDES